MEKWSYFFKHLWPSLKGWPRLFIKSPVFSLALFYQRAFFFMFRRLPCKLHDPAGFQIDTPFVLNSYWNMFVEQSLYSKEWTSPFLKHSLPLVIDVGANAGVFTHFLVLMNPNVEIIAFEPLPAMAVRIEARIASTGMNAKVKRAACSDRCGKQKLYFSSIDDTTASLQADNCDDKKEIAVAVRTLDSEMPERRDVFLVKIDAEGHELAVLRGAEQTIKKTSYLIIEANSCEAFERVRNFLGEQWFPQKLDLNNYLFLKKGKRPSHSVN